MTEHFKRVEPWEAGLPKWTYYKDQTSGNYQGGQYKEGYQGPNQYQGGQYKEGPYQYKEGYYQGPYQYQGGQYKEGYQGPYQYQGGQYKEGYQGPYQYQGGQYKEGYQGPYQYQGGQYKEGYYRRPYQGQYKEQDVNREVAKAVKSYYVLDDLRSYALSDLKALSDRTYA